MSARRRFAPLSMSLAALGLVCCLAATPAAGFIRSTLSATDATPIQWDLDETLLPLASVDAGEVLYVIDVAGSSDFPGTEEMEAVERAFQHWEGVGSSRIAFRREPDQAIQAANDDGINAVYWAEGSRTQIGGTNTNVTGFIALSPVFSVTAGAAKGMILDANIIFNGRQESWTVTPDLVPTSYDVEAIATHEVGHFLGLDHSPVIGSTMSPRFFTGEARQRVLHSDDALGASQIYPEGSFTSGAFGSIGGLIGRPAPVFGALVAVTDTDGNVIQESVTAANGNYGAPGLEDGDYDVYAEPMDASPPSSTNLFDETDLGGVYGSTVDTGFIATLPALTSVTAPSNTTRSFIVGSTPPALNISKIGGRASTLPGVVFNNAPTFGIAGDSNILIGVSGPNVGPVSSFEITGAGITDNGVVATGSVDGEPSVIKSFSIALNAPQGLRSIRVTAGALGRTYATGAFRVYPNLAMSLASPGVYFSGPGEVNNGRFPNQNPLSVVRRGDDLDLDWDDEPGAYGYHVYRGSLNALLTTGYDHQEIPGSINGQCSLSTSDSVLKGEALDPAASYYLVTAYNNAGEGITGRNSSNQNRPAALPACPTP